MIKIHGSEEAVRDFMRKSAIKSSGNKSGKGGFGGRSEEELISIGRGGAETRWRKRNLM